MKKRVDITLDADICVVIEQIRSEAAFAPSRSKIINDLLRKQTEIKRRLNKK